MASIKTILHITPFFHPNIGGVETHLDDLTYELHKRGYKQIVLTYSPLSTIVPYQKSELSTNLLIHRFYLPGHNLFHSLEKFPLLNFLYITPCLLFHSLIWLLVNHPHIDTIHSHGLNSALIGNIIKKFLRIPKHITSIYSTYDNVPLNSTTTKLFVHILNNTDKVLTQSDQSVIQLRNLGVIKNKIARYYHWIDITRFKPIPKKSSKFSVLFIGRLIPQKNSITLATLAPEFTQIRFDFIGTGPELENLKTLAKKYSNINLIGDVPYKNLPQFYQQATVFCMPSTYHEGWGRVLAESVACGTPVICSNLGGTTEAVDSSVAIIVPPTSDHFKKSIKKLFENPSQLRKLRYNCHTYAKKHYSSDNVTYITRHY
ncbi:glycosyltransferase family 4 protein [Candidatus Shapirobacteria bacterium]|nr:glycosyltransferase family 4 protein [Candidatus Shapirobacteria bacterium]